MDNFFVSRLFDWGWRREGRALALANGLLHRLGSSWAVQRGVTPFCHTTTLEQRINLWHLASNPLAYGVPGDLVELGCFDGKTAVIFARVIEQFDPLRRLHLFDHFEVGFHLGDKDVEQEVRLNFAAAGAPGPIIHRGDFCDTVPSELPATIAFAHFDCGFGGDPAIHCTTVTRLLEHVYPRMPAGAIGVFMDCHDIALCAGRDHNPGVAPAVSDFFADKPEGVISLWGGEYSHAYFRKAGAPAGGF